VARPAPSARAINFDGNAAVSRWSRMGRDQGLGPLSLYRPRLDPLWERVLPVNSLATCSVAVSGPNDGQGRGLQGNSCHHYHARSYSCTHNLPIATRLDCRPQRCFKGLRKGLACWITG